MAKEAKNLQLSENRKARKYAPSELFRRVLWGGGKIFFRWSPRTAFGWRRAILRLFGAKVGSHVHIYNTAVIYFPWNFRIDAWSAIGEHALIYNLGMVTIGAQVTISQHAHVCAGTHDYTDPTMPLLKPPITIEDQVWICADAFVGPSVRVGTGAIVAARAVAVKDVPPWHIVAGNPARFLKLRSLDQPTETS